MFQLWTGIAKSKTGIAKSRTGIVKPRTAISAGLFCVTLLGTSITGVVWAEGFGHKVDISARADDRSGRELRYQYRLRYYPRYQFDQTWSLNGFAVTGDEFSSSYNTMDDGAADHFYLRRLYFRKQDGVGKTEFGYLPTYKGRVSSTGLSKDGWIAGIRHVQPVKNGLFEVVVGALDRVDDANAIQQVRKLNYLEVEYSAHISEQFSYETSFDRMLDTNFLRGEIRYKSDSDVVYALELIHRLDENKAKVVASVERDFQWFGRPLSFFGYYAYVSEQFGPRAELTEDFLSTGHGLAMEVEGESGVEGLDWFAKTEIYEGNSRFQLGVKLKLSSGD